MLNDINKLSDIKKLDIQQLESLSAEIRNFLIESVSKTGGHLASNLGVVELTLALNYSFDFNKDKIIWDVGHQSYVHKILTGRRERFGTLRHYKGLSGFPKTSESKYDFFNTGHSSTSISAAFGMAVGRDIKKQNHNVIAVIGDGSMTGGLAYEALNNAGRTDTRLIVILNDNEMSISENVGAVSRYLNRIRTAPGYIGAKRGVSDFLDRLPLVGKPVAKMIGLGKDSLKYALLDGKFFDDLGFTYVGPIDGHDIPELINVFNKVKKLRYPILLHVITKKGKGYLPAENRPEDFHGIDGFDAVTGHTTVKRELTYSSVFGNTLCDIAEQNNRIIAISASMITATGLGTFKDRFPDRTFDVGIAEAHAVTFSAGLAKAGFIPVFAVYSSFLQRAYDQILHDCCLQNLHVVFAIDRAGIVGADGETHQGCFDISFLSHMPNMTVLAPRNGPELEQMLRYTMSLNSPVAIRYPRSTASKLLNSHCPDIERGKPELIEEGDDLTIVSVGAMMEQCFQAAELLKERGFSPALYNARFVKPIDDEFIKKLASYPHVFIAEDNITSGGYGTSVLQKFCGLGLTTDIHLLSFPDEFIEQGTRTELFRQYQLDADGIYEKIIQVIEKSHDE